MQGLVFFIVAVAVACASPTWAADQPVHADYVGSKVCATCHEDAFQAWRGSHHDLAMQPADTATVLGDFSDATLTHFGVTSTFFRRDGGFWVRTDGPDGAMDEFEIAYTFGVDPLQQYLIRFPGGRLQALGIAWDTRPAPDGGQRWFHLYPNDAVPAGDVLHWTGRFQNWNVMCAECHSTGLQKAYDTATDSFATTWAEIDVGCEACHGPGRDHVAWARSGDQQSGSAELKGLVVDFLASRAEGGWEMDADRGTARWSGPPRDRAELQVCAACHARRQPLTEGWQAGDGFHDTHALALLDDGLYHADGQILDEVFVHGSFLQSRMHRAGVVCSDCHEPHSLALKAPGNAVCSQCHLPEKFDVAAHHHHQPGAPGSQCVDCHMPARTYMVVDPRRDHSFRVPRPDLSVALGTPNACIACHDDKTDRWAARTVAAWYGPGRRQEEHFATALHAGRTGQPGAAAALAETVLDPDVPAIARATALSLLPRYASPASLPAYRAGLGADDPLLRRAGLQALAPFHPTERLRLAAPLLADPVRAVRIEAARQLAAVPAEAFRPTDRRRFERAAEEYLAAQALLAAWPQTHVNLGLFHTDRGDYARADAAYQAALDRDPAFVPAFLNRADLARLRGQEAVARGILKAGLKAAPDAAPLHHALGLAQVRQGRTAEALASLRTAADLAPDQPRYAYVYAVALNSTGSGGAALDTLEAARSRHPNDPDLLLALATINRDRGAFDRAVGYAEQLVALRPQDAQARRLLDALTAAARRP